MAPEMVRDGSSPRWRGSLCWKLLSDPWTRHYHLLAQIYPKPASLEGEPRRDSSLARACCNGRDMGFQVQQT